MSTVIRDFIPADEDLTAAEAKRIASRARGVKLDFIPDPEAEVAEPGTPEAHLAESQARVKRMQGRGEESMAHVKAKAAERLAQMNVPQAIDHIETLSFVEKKLWVAAEVDGQARKGILTRFKV